MDNNFKLYGKGAGYMEIDISEVIETTKKILLLYKESINGFIDRILLKVIKYCCLI